MRDLRTWLFFNVLLRWKAWRGRKQQKFHCFVLDDKTVVMLATDPKTKVWMDKDGEKE